MKPAHNSNLTKPGVWKKTCSAPGCKWVDDDHDRHSCHLAPHKSGPHICSCGAYSTDTKKKKK